MSITFFPSPEVRHVRTRNGVCGRQASRVNRTVVDNARTRGLDGEMRHGSDLKCYAPN